MKVLVTEAFDALCKSLVGTPPADVDRLRCVMRLWLASDVVRHLLNNWPEGETGSLTYRRREAVRGVAACVREHLRYESHARWASCDPSDENSASKLGLVFDYLYQPGAVHDALCSLVHLHAHYVVGLPQTLDVRRLLRAIGDGRTGATRLVAAGHQQHVLDIYAFGHLLLKARYTEGTESQQRSDEDAGGNLSDTRSSAPRTLGGWLASRSESDPGKAAFVRLRQTFSLAVLYHDSGLLLFPRPRSIHPAVHRELRALRVPLQRVEEAHHNAGRELARVCRVELDTLGLASPQRDPGLATWLDEQEQEGRPDHALVGAWHLCRAAATSPAVDPDVLRAAARAILLHGAPTEVVHAEQDPAGWLLVLCDEVFEWDPNGRPDHGLQTVLRAPAGHGLQTGALRGRAEQISVSGLTLENKPKHVKDPKHHTPWPTIAVGGPGRRLWIRVQMVSPDQRDQSTVRAWLTTSQNVWRLDVPRSLAGGDAPRAVRLELCSVAPTQQTGQRTRELIERALHHVDLAIVGHLRQWADELALDEGSDVEPGGEVESSIGMEVLAIHPRGRPICDRDIRPYLDAVVDEARRWDRARR